MGTLGGGSGGRPVGTACGRAVGPAASNRSVALGFGQGLVQPARTTMPGPQPPIPLPLSPKRGRGRKRGMANGWAVLGGGFADRCKYCTMGPTTCLGTDTSTIERRLIAESSTDEEHEVPTRPDRSTCNDPLGERAPLTGAHRSTSNDRPRPHSWSPTHTNLPHLLAGPATPRVAPRPTRPGVQDRARPELCCRNQPHKARIRTRIGATSTSRCGGAGFRPESWATQADLSEPLVDLMRILYKAGPQHAPDACIATHDAPKSTNFGDAQRMSSRAAARILSPGLCFRRHHAAQERKSDRNRLHRKMWAIPRHPPATEPPSKPKVGMASG